MATVTITATTARSKSCNVAYHRILSRRDAIMDDAITALAEYGAMVSAELDTIAALDHETRARRASAFAILSPQADFADNVRAVPVLLDNLRRFATPKQHVAALRAVGYKMTYDKKAEQYVASADLILRARPQDITFANVQKHLGFGKKTASMFCALYNQWLPVITLDTWMLSGLLGVAATGGKKNKNTYTADGQAYDDIAALLLDVAATLGVSPFCLQWSLWAYYRGGFDSHLPIFGI